MNRVMSKGLILEYAIPGLSQYSKKAIMQNFSDNAKFVKLMSNHGIIISEFDHFRFVVHNAEIKDYRLNY